MSKPAVALVVVSHDHPLSPPPAIEAAATFVVALPEGALTPESARQSLSASGITASDCRTDVHLHLHTTDATEAVVGYALALGFLRRVPERVIVGTQSLPVASMNRTLRTTFAPLPISAGPVVGIGLPAAADRVTLDVSQPWDHDQFLSVRNAAEVRWCPPVDPATALTQLVVLSATRAAPPKERLPIVDTGTGDAVWLDAVRKQCSQWRSVSGQEDRSTLVRRVDPSPRALRLQQAADTPVAAALHRLGVTDLECPRRSRHNRPADPFTLADNRGECSVCDPYPIDTLRLVMDTTGMVADDAADWILGDQTTPLASVC